MQRSGGVFLGFTFECCDCGGILAAGGGPLNGQASLTRICEIIEEKYLEAGTGDLTHCRCAYGANDGVSGREYKILLENRIASEWPMVDSEQLEYERSLWAPEDDYGGGECEEKKERRAISPVGYGVGQAGSG